MGKVLSILVALLAIWGALANIAPDVFQVRQADRLMEFLWGPKTIWLVLLIGGLFIAALMFSVDRRLETAAKQKDDRLRRELSESFKADLLRFQAESLSIATIREARIRIDIHDYNGPFELHWNVTARRGLGTQITLRMLLTRCPMP